MTSWAPRLAEMKASPATQAGIDRPDRKKSVAGSHEPPERKADPQHEAEVDQHDQIVDPCQCGLHARFLSSSARRIAGARLSFHVGAHELLGWGDIMTPIPVNLNRPESAEDIDLCFFCHLAVSWFFCDGSAGKPYRREELEVGAAVEVTKGIMPEIDRPLKPRSNYSSESKNCAIGLSVRRSAVRADSPRACVRAGHQVVLVIPRAGVSALGLADVLFPGEGGQSQ